MPFDFHKTRDDATKDQEELLQRKSQIALEKKTLEEEEKQVDLRLIALEQILEGIEVATSDGPPDLEPLGFTDHVRKILSQTTVPLLPTQIRELLITQGVTGSSRRNLLISIHTILGRIESELEKVKVDGKVAYIARGNPYFPKKDGESRRAPRPLRLGARRRTLSQGATVGIPKWTPPPKKID